MPSAEEALREYIQSLPAGLLYHIERMAIEAERLAELHGLDKEKARLATLGHDIFRATPPDELLRLARDNDLDPNDIERAEPVLMHGIVAARVLPQRFGLNDPEVLAAVASHTTGRAGMSPLETVVFIADKTEPGGLRFFPEWSEVRDLAERSLDDALARALELSIQHALKEGWLLHPNTIAAHNYMLLKKRGA